MTVGDNNPLEFIQQLVNLADTRIRARSVCVLECQYLRNLHSRLPSLLFLFFVMFVCDHNRLYYTQKANFVNEGSWHLEPLLFPEVYVHTNRYENGQRQHDNEGCKGTKKCPGTRLKATRQ